MALWDGGWRVGDGCELGQQGAKKPDQPSAEEAKIVADAGEDGVDSITFDAEQEVSTEMAIGFHVADDRLDGGAAAQLAADGGGDAALLAADENAGPIGIVAAIAAIDIDTGDGGAGDPLDLFDLPGQGVAVIGIAGKLCMPRTNCSPGACPLVVATETLTPNAKRVLALPLPMHASSGACRE
jgi:hypothetical protein